MPCVSRPAAWWEKAAFLMMNTTGESTGPDRKKPRTIPCWRRRAYRREITGGKRRIPPQPEEDILWFVTEYGDLEEVGKRYY